MTTLRSPQTEGTGYLHEAYARSLAEFGRPRHLRASGGWILERAIPGSDREDAMGCYPLLCCRDWSRLSEDVVALGDALVSMVAVTDPFAEDQHAPIRECFDEVMPFKDHLVVDLSVSRSQRTSRHHRYYARLAQRRGITVDRCDDPIDHLDDWNRLYGDLAQRHGLTGIKRFSPNAFSEQLRVPGAVMFRALQDERTIAAHVWYLQGDAAYSHLQAADERAYESRAAYALYGVALDELAQHCSYADLGAAAGTAAASNDGLAVFKRGWATESRVAYLCKSVLDRAAYSALTGASGAGEPAYFPAYRAGELN